MIVKFLEKWEQGFKIAIGVKPRSTENKIMFLMRKTYYTILRKISETPLVDNFTGFGLYDHDIIEILKKIDEPYPYMRGLICEIGFEKALVEFDQPARVRGLTKNNFFTLYDAAMLGITSHSKVPLRIATLLGFLIALLSIGVATVYFVLKLLMWDSFVIGQAPNVIGLFFFGAVQMFFIGMLGEYIGTILIKVNHRPLVVERKRLNFISKDEGKNT
ncbi:MAG: hypothetical protein H7Y41_07800 [Hyphomonadaceae bacterium]|nr:hypothetical protein [Clostridia bacterium]